MRSISLVTSLILASVCYSDDDPTRLFPEKSQLKDIRLGKPRDLNGYFPFSPPPTRQAWDDRAKRVRTQVLVANGLWPMPEKTPLNPVIHGKIERDGYTIEKVHFASMPGHYVTGNLYRPTARIDGKRPAVLNPHGHWANGRFYEQTEAQAKKDVASGAEKTLESARYPLQAKCAQLARLGYVTFLYDMVGYADSTAIGHRTGFTDAESELRLQNFMGLQTWNSIRALDFLLSLPDVDPGRVGVTGASGGGTQTFILGAIDDRPAAAFPAVMVSTAMQGGCICENCSYLRVGTGNIELAGLFAPRPLAMSGANDWTKEIESKGLPELKQLYKVLGAEDQVAARCWPEFGHNYNQVAREMMYAWFDKHLKKGTGAGIAEQPFVPVPPRQLSVYDAEHPRPQDELDARSLRAKMTEASDRQIKALEPKDAKSLDQFRKVFGPALQVMIGEALPTTGTLEVRHKPKEVKLPDGVTMHLAALGRKGEGDMVPFVGLFKDRRDSGTVIWVHPDGKSSLFEKGQLQPAVRALLDSGYAVVSLDAFQTGELKGSWPRSEGKKKNKEREPADESRYPVDRGFAGYTFGYNRPVFANRVHDILTAVAFARDMLKSKSIHLVGWEGAGPWVVAARALCGDVVGRTAVDLNQFRFENIKDVADENLLPGAVKYGGLPAMLALCAPGELFAHNHAGTHSGQLAKAAYEAAGKNEALKRQSEKAKPADVISWLKR